MDEMKIFVEAKLDAADGGTMADEQARLAGFIKDIIGVTAAVEVVMPGTIARSIGKVQRIRDLRKL